MLSTMGSSVASGERVLWGRVVHQALRQLSQPTQLPQRPVSL